MIMKQNLYTYLARCMDLNMNYYDQYEKYF